MPDDTFDVVMIGHFPEDPLFIKGGVQASIYGLSRALRVHPEIGRVVAISLPMDLEQGRQRWQNTWDGIDVTYITAPSRFMISSLVNLPYTMRLISGLKHPIVHVHGTGMFQAAVCCVLRIKRIPFIWTLHGLAENETRETYRQNRSVRNALRYGYYTLLERFKLAIVPHIFVNTPYVLNQLKTKSKVHVLPIGIFVQEFAALQGNIRTAPVIFSLAVLNPNKGHHLMLEAFSRVREKIPDAQLILAGVSLAGPAYFKSLQPLAANLRIEDAVEFAVSRPRSEIVSHFGQARVFALHSKEETQGLVLCEALASGVPVVSTRVGGIPYVITEGQDGFLVDYGDVAGFTDAILRLLTDDALHARMSQQAIISSNRFDWKNIAPDVVKIYRQVAGGSVEQSPAKRSG